MDTLFTGRNRIELGAVGSTNSYAMELLKNTSLPEGTVIITDEQMQGRGQRGNSWISAPGLNLTCSIVLYPGFLPVGEQFMLSKIVSMALVKMLEGILEEKVLLKIKWPNDIYAGDKKIAGILIENTLRQENISASVIGIGINVNQTDLASLVQGAISVKDLTGTVTDLAELLDTLCSSLEGYYLQLKAGRTEAIDTVYREYLYRFGETALFKTGSSTIEGNICGVSREGKLRVVTENGIREFGLKEISFIISKHRP